MGVIVGIWLLRVSHCQTDVKHIMCDIIQSYGSMASLGVKFYSTIARNVPPFVFLDPLRIRQIIANGVTNALKYTPSGEVRVHVRCW